MLQQRRSFFSPPHPAPHTSRYISAVLISSLGKGLWLSFALLYFHLVTHLPQLLVDLGLTTGVDAPQGCLSSLIRASVHYYDSEEEVEHFCTVLRSMIWLTVERNAKQPSSCMHERI